MTPREYLAGLEFHGIKLGLDNILGLLRSAGDPHRGFPSVHVAGTNGKGSVLAFLDAMLRAAGYRTGRFTSPHLIDVTERFLVTGQPISNADLDRHLMYFRDIAEREGIAVTYFEMVTAIAFCHFNEAAVDVGLIEVGMGGRFDATNVLTPIATAITPIDYDHMQYLGNSLEAIAGEKAGILKQGVPAVVGETRSPARDVLMARADELGVPVMALGDQFVFDALADSGAFRYESEELQIECTSLGLAGPHQRGNAAIAVALAETLRERYPGLTQAAIVEGLSSAHWPCRMECVLDSPPVIVDSAHNPAAFEVLAGCAPRGIVVLAVSKDKHVEGMVRAAERFAARFVFTQYSGGRGMPAEELSVWASSVPYEVVPTIPDAIDRALELAGALHPVLISGSIFAAGEARRYLIDRYGAAPLRF